MRRRSVVGAVLSLALVACGAEAPLSADGGELSGTVTVLAASSLTGVLEQLAEDFEKTHPEVDVRLSLGSSASLAQQVVNGAPADVFASASTTSMQVVVDAGKARDPRLFARNTAAVAVHPGSAGTVRELADLADRGVTVALCEVAVPCGRVAAEVLAAAGLDVRPVTRGLDVKAVLATVVRGDVDAAIVYTTDVLAAGGSVVPLVVPEAFSAGTDYPIATLDGSGSRAAAEAFTDLVLSEAGASVLAAAGFVLP